MNSAKNSSLLDDLIDFLRENTTLTEYHELCLKAAELNEIFLKRAKEVGCGYSQ